MRSSHIFRIIIAAAMTFAVLGMSGCTGGKKNSHNGYECRISAI